jgi:hypothetical protein
VKRGREDKVRKYGMGILELEEGGTGSGQCEMAGLGVVCWVVGSLCLFRVRYVH